MGLVEKKKKQRGRENPRKDSLKANENTHKNEQTTIKHKPETNKERGFMSNRNLINKDYSHYN